MAAIASAVERVHVVTAAATTVLVVIDPLRGWRSGAEWETWLEGQQRLDRVMSRVAPVLFVATASSAAGAAVVSARAHRPVAATCRTSAAAFVVTAVAVTLRVNEPVNERLRQWRPADPPAPEWRSTRARWERGHRLRRALLATVAVATALGSWGPGPTAAAQGTTGRRPAATLRTGCSRRR